MTKKERKEIKKQIERVKGWLRLENDLEYNLPWLKGFELGRIDALRWVLQMAKKKKRC